MSHRLTTFSPCRAYRYTLWRQWDLLNDSYAMFIGLNPSTADEVQDDPTIRRCIGFAKRWGYGGLCMTNIFAYRATDPKLMKAQADPVGPDNDRALLDTHYHAGIRVAAWGCHGAHMGRDKAVRQFLKDLRCLGITKDGQPKHPLYIRSEQEPIDYCTDQPAACLRPACW